MNICGDCRSTFEEPIVTTEQIGEFWGTPAYGKFYSCPYCGSEAVEEARECVICGEPIESESNYCDSCLGFVNEAVSDFISEVSKYLNTDHNTALELILANLERR
jgi:hypothetical protein